VDYDDIMMVNGRQVKSNGIQPNKLETLDRDIKGGHKNLALKIFYQPKTGKLNNLLAY
jgi:hypothetical protein